MSEEKKNFELADDDLDAVNGGVFTGNGQIGPGPGAGGIGTPSSVFWNNNDIGKDNLVASKGNKNPAAPATTQQASSTTAVPGLNILSGDGVTQNYMV